MSIRKSLQTYVYSWHNAALHLSLWWHCWKCNNLITLCPCHPLTFIFQYFACKLLDQLEKMLFRWSSISLIEILDRDKMSNLYRGPSIDASYQVSVHMTEGFQRRLPVGAMFVNGSGRNEQSL
jgi:hypothetical protein